MKTIIKDKTILFYNDYDQEIMYMDYSTDECIWGFPTNNVINITKDMELYELLDDFMKNSYVFNDDVLQNYKDDNKLIWYSDCYYNPDDEWSVASVSCLNIERSNDEFNLWCSKKLDEMINRPNKSYVIAFSPLGNGKYSRNLNTEFTLQDDFAMGIYQPLLNKNKVLKK